MNHDFYDDNYIRDILTSVRTIALVGISANPSRPSHSVFRFLLARGYRVIPVNPGLAGTDLLGQRVYARLGDIPEPVDMVDVFRATTYVFGVVQEAVAMNPRPKVIWMQLDIRDDAAATLAEARGIKVVMNRCPAIEFGRLGLGIA